MLQVNNVSKSFGTNPLLKDVTFSVEDGETVVLLGPSGVGKSTLLKMMAGLLPPDCGRIEVNGTVVFDSAKGSAVNLPPRSRSIGYVPQDYLLFPFLSAYDNITFGMKGRMPTHEMDSIIAPIVSLLEIEGVMRLYPSQLSGGQRQRVALARSLALRPKLLMLDEPMSNLDPGLRDRVRIEMKTFLKKIGATTLYVTHHLADSFVLGDKVAVVMEGGIKAMASPQQLLTSPSTIEVGRLLGLNCYVGKALDRKLIEVDGIQLSTAELPVGAGSEVLVSVRPDCVHPVFADAMASPNILRGKVLHVFPGVSTVNLDIDAGIEVQCCLTRGLWDALGTKEKEQIVVHIAPEDLNVAQYYH